MLPPGFSLTCPTPATCLDPIPGLAGGLAGGIAGGAANAAAGAVLGAVSASMSSAADWLIGHVMGLMQATTTPHFDAAWFKAEAGLMETVVTVVVLPILMVASIGPVLRQDGRRLFRVWAVGLPVAVLAGAAGSQLAGLALNATDALCGVFLGAHSQQLAGQFSDTMASGVTSQVPVVVSMVLSALTVAGAVLVWLEMMVRSAAVYVAVFFMPVVLVGYIWPATAGMAKRGVEILASLILAKFVVVAALSLGLAALGGRGPDATVAGAGMMLLAGFAPFTLLRLAPVVEAAAIGHLEGMSRRPARAATRAVGTSAAVPGHPLSQMIMSAASGGGRGAAPAAASVAAQMLPERSPDILWPDPPGTGDGPPGDTRRGPTGG